jgi:hypothetical protein
MFTEQPPKLHIFTFGNRYRSSETTRTMDVLFSAAVQSFFELDLGACYEKLCLENHPDSTIYRLLEGTIGEKLQSPKGYDRVRKACIETHNWKELLQ